MTKTYYLSASGIKVESYNGETLIQTTFYSWSNVYVSDIYHLSGQIILLVNGTTKTPSIVINNGDDIDGFNDFNDVISYVLYSVSTFSNNLNINNAPLNIFVYDNVVDMGDNVIMESLYAIGNDSDNFIQFWDKDPTSEGAVLLETYPIPSKGERFISFGEYGQSFDSLYIVASSHQLTYSDGGSITFKIRYK